MTMTTSQETLTEATREAIASSVQIWADSVQRFVGLMPTPDAKVPSPEEVVDNMFAFAAQGLATQREFIKSLLAASKSAATNAAWVSQGGVKKKS